MRFSNKARLKQFFLACQGIGFGEHLFLEKTFTLGVNHETHLVSNGLEKYVIKLFRSPQSGALSAQQWAARLKLAPEVLYHNQNADMALFSYLDAPTLSNQALSANDVISLAHALKTLHSAPQQKLVTQLGQCDLRAFWQQYLDQIKGDFGQFGQAQNLHQCLLPTMDIFLQDQTPWSLCHNDLVNENCFIVDGNALFIDWEFAQAHNPWFDIAALIYYCRLNNDQAALLLKNYHPASQQQVGQPIFWASQIALLWTDILWHVAKRGWNAWPNLGQKMNDLKNLAERFEITL